MKLGLRDIFFVGVIGAGAVAMGAGLIRQREPVPPQPLVKTALTTDPEPIVKSVDDSFRTHWAAAKMVPSEKAGDLVLMRRLSLALCGTVPSLEEIRRFECRPERNAGQRMARFACSKTAAAPTTSPSDLPGFMSAPKTVRSSFTGGGGSSPGSATHSRKPALRQIGPGDDRRPRPVDRPTRDQLRFRHL